MDAIPTLKNIAFRARMKKLQEKIVEAMQAGANPPTSLMLTGDERPCPLAEKELIMVGFKIKHINEDSSMGGSTEISWTPEEGSE